MDRWMWAFVAVAAAAVVVVAMGKERSQAAKRPAERVAPAVALPRLGGGTAGIEKGKVTVVDFWATWCAPCRASMPRLQKVWREYQPRGVDLYSVDTDDPGGGREDAVREFLLQNQLTFPVVLDDGTASSAFAIANLPTMLVIDRDGHVVWDHVGALTAGREEELRGILDRALTARN
jgi:cytochrome c biogenesis protein CcmG, thiol:disulfide interchange protein DsbE